MTAIGLAIGLLGALAVGRAVSSFLYDVSPFDGIVFLGVTVLLAAVALLGCYVPARRAARVDPMTALRHE